MDIVLPKFVKPTSYENSFTPVCYVHVDADYG